MPTAGSKEAQHGNNQNAVIGVQDQGSHGNIGNLLNLILISTTQLNLITLLLLITELITPHKHATHRNCIVMSQIPSELQVDTGMRCQRERFFTLK